MAATARGLLSSSGCVGTASDYTLARTFGQNARTMIETDALILTRAQRDLYVERAGDSTEDAERFVADLLLRVSILIRQRCVHGREPRILLEQLAEAHRRVVCDPRDPAARAAIWSLVESLTRWPWGAGAYGAIDRLVVAGAVADELARARTE